MSLRLSAKCGDSITTNLAKSLLFETTLTSSDLDQARADAFSSRTFEEFRWHYLKSECFSKWGEYAEDDLSRVAYDSFFETERALQLVNRWLVAPKFTWVYDESRLNKARAIIYKILGSFSLEELVRSCEWSSGASTEFKRRTSQIENKWVLSSHMTAGIYPYYAAFRKWAPWPEIGVMPKFVSGNKVTTVPKSYKTDRAIAVEPSWNMFFQKGIGKMIRRRLQRFGQLTPTAQFKARDLARRGSGTGLLATLDLKGASDSVSVALCELLLPPDWFEHLMNTRSQIGTVEGRVVPYAKLSSMGNGYTFELETLIFYALSCTHSGIGNKWTHVYGDDIIVTSDLAEPLALTLAEVGFDLNSDKSFWNGPFRESCGGHYWNGRDVTPFYLKGRPRHVGDVITLHNKVLKWLHVGENFVRGDFDSLLARCRRLVPKSFWGPMWEEGALWSHWDATRPSWHSDYQSFVCRRLLKVPKFDDSCEADVDLWERGAYMQALWKERSDWHKDEWEPGTYKFQASKFYVDRSRWFDPTV